jgi:peptidylprolyl isomerase
MGSGQAFAHAQRRDLLINSRQEHLELESAMKHTALLLLITAATVAASAQTTPAKPANTHSSAAKPAITVHASTATGIKLPPGVPPAKGILKTAFALKYQDIAIGTGADAEPNKLYKVHYTLWLADTGVKIDSSYDHPGQPIKDKDGKPVLGDDGKPKVGDPQPFQFPQGARQAIPGFDAAFYGMKIGGKRRIFIPWQLAYGELGRKGPDAAHPGIPPKADLIFDVLLVDVTEMPAPPMRPGMPPGRMPPGMTPHPPAGATPQPGTAPATPPAATVPAKPATPPPTNPPSTTTPPHSF